MKRTEYIHIGNMSKEDLEFCLKLGYFGTPPQIEKIWLDTQENIHILVIGNVSRQASEELELKMRE
jgi:hypothetical protein